MPGSRRHFLGATMACLATGLARSGEPDDLGAKILTYARSKMGEQVGDGECGTLLGTAFREVGARRPPPFGADVDFVWGEPIENWSDARPGDLLQFRDAEFRSRKTIRERGRTTIRTTRTMYPHHSAIVAEVAPRGRALTILHQNVGDDPATRKTVQEATIVRAELQKGGKVWIYRATPVGDRSPFASTSRTH